jgi:hypothetical protein
VGATQSKSKKAGPRISAIAREKKLQFFFGQIRRDAKILDVGCADGWAEQWARERGWTDVTGLDLTPPADVVGDIREWKNLGLEAHFLRRGPRVRSARARRLRGSDPRPPATGRPSHGHDAGAAHGLALPGGEAAGLLQRRTSPHTHLIDLRQLPRFKAVEHQVKGLALSQWGVLRPA